jgi:glucosyl-3-phosphoglycerate synthase
MPSPADRWPAARIFHHREFDPAALAASRQATVSVCLPARNEAATIGPILEALLPLKRSGLLDQIVVVDDSTDGTAGDAMWRSLTVLKGELICFLDADSELFGAHFAYGLLGPLIADSEISLVKGFYRRPFRLGQTTMPDGGGRVTELTARPLLAHFYPELAPVRQPLAGEIAARRELLEALPFVTGYGVDIGLLLDAYRAVGLAGLAQVDLDVRQNAHQPLRDLGPMALEILRTVASRLEHEERLEGQGELPLERPPLITLRAAA